jgi:hypothetical protein
VVFTMVDGINAPASLLARRAWLGMARTGHLHPTALRPPLPAHPGFGCVKFHHAAQVGSLKVAANPKTASARDGALPFAPPGVVGPAPCDFGYLPICRNDAIELDDNVTKLNQVTLRL